MKKKIVVSILLGISLIFTGCGSDNTGGETTTEQQTQEEGTTEASVQDVTIKVAGSTSVAPLMKELIDVYEANNSHVTVEMQESGSSAGISSTIAGVAEIGMSSRDLKAEEIEEGLVETAIALDGIAVIVNEGNAVSDLTSDQVAAIFKGEISNWSEIGGDNAEIIVISREEGSGTRAAFEELLSLEEQIEQEDGSKLTQSLLTGEALFENSTGAVKTNVMSSPNAIGYISLGSLDDSVKALQVNGVEASGANILDGSYVISRPFLICTLGEAQGEAAKFIQFILSDEGQSVVTQENYISVQ